MIIMLHGKDSVVLFSVLLPICISSVSFVSQFLKTSGLSSSELAQSSDLLLVQQCQTQS